MILPVILWYRPVIFFLFGTHVLFWYLGDGDLTECVWMRSSSAIFWKSFRIGGFPGGAKESTCQCRSWERHMGLIPGSGRSPGGGNGNPLQYSYLENSMNRGHSAWDCKRVRHNWACTHTFGRTHLPPLFSCNWMTLFYVTLTSFLSAVDLGVLVYLWFLYSSLYI